MSLGQRIIAMYDRTQFASPRHQAFYRYSGYSNVGYWYPDTRDGMEAGNNLVDKLVERMGSVRGGAILDVACGQGGTTRRLCEHAGPGRVTAINLSPRQLRQTRVHAPRCHTAIMDAARLGFAGQTFDHVVCVEAAFHFDTREAFLREAYRVLRPGGQLALSDVILRGRRVNQLLHRVGYPVTCPVANHQSMAEYQALLQRIGFVDVRMIDVLDRTFARFWRKFALASVRSALDSAVAGLAGQPGFEPISLPVLLPFLVAQTFWFRNYVLVHARKP